jgi:hypothetical protein
MQDLTPKVTKAKRAGDVAQVVECLPSKHRVLSLGSFSTTKKKQGQNMGMSITYLGSFQRKFKWLKACLIHRLQHQKIRTRSHQLLMPSKEDPVTD